MATLFRTDPLIVPEPPRLPAAEVEYSQRYQDQFTNILRLYFNRIKNFEQLFTTNIGGALLQFPNGAFYQDGYTTLTANMTNVSTTPIQVTSTTGFLPAGGLLIENEIVKYTGITPTTFTGITRGAYSSTNTAHTAGVYVSEAQPAPSSTTALAVSMTSTTTSNDVSINVSDITRVDFSVAGYYSIGFSSQLLSFDSAVTDVNFWFRKNGVDIPNSAHLLSVPAVKSGTAGLAIASYNLIQPINAGDYIQLMYATFSGNVVLVTYPPGTAPVHPASPSVILTATFVSALF